jgi:integrase
MKDNSTPKKVPRKAAKKRKHFVPPKPYPDFPLTPHPGGVWMKKILGKIHYFGRWGRIRKGNMERLPDDSWWQDALAIYKAQADDLHAGRTPSIKTDGLTVVELRGRFLTAKSRALDAGEISARTYAEYRATADLLIATFGENRLVDDLASNDFEALRDDLAKRFGPVRLGNEVQKVRTVFKYGFETGLIDKPIRYGPQFKKPSASVLRRHRAKNGERMIEADEIRRLLFALDGKRILTGRMYENTGQPETVKLAANSVLKAMILLGVNCGFIGKDCTDLPLLALDLKDGWIIFPRPKTGIPRRCPLWKETVEALKTAIAERPEPKDKAAEKLVFVTTRGRPWITRGTANPVSVAARDLMKAVGIHRDGIGFATLRHVFRTVADVARDQVATNYIMGHSDPSMGAVYRERIDDSRLLAVTTHVRNWLFGEKV